MNSHPRLPLVGLTVCFLAGTACGLLLPARPLVLAAAGLPVLLLASLLAWGRRPFAGAGTTATLATVLLAGWLNAALRASGESRPPPGTPGGDGRVVEILGLVEDEPVEVVSRHVGYRFPFRIEKIRSTDDPGWQEGDGRLWLTWYRGESAAKPSYGDRWRMGGSLQVSTPAPSARGREQAPFLRLAEPVFIERVSTNNGNRFIAASLESRRKARDLLTLGIEHHPEESAVLNSLLLGYRSQMPRDIYRAYAATGTLHIFAISGSHVVILAAIIVFALGVLRIPRTRWVLGVAPLLVFYTVMTGLQPSAVRACIMAIVFLLAPLLGRRPDIYTALAFSAVLIVAVVPSDVFNVGFILSFIAMLGIVLLYPICLRPLKGLCFQPDPLSLQPDPWPRQVARTVWNDISVLLATSAAAWVVTTPLTAYYFQMFSPIALLGNLVAIPLASLIITAGSLSLVAGSCIPFLAEVFNHTNYVLAWLLTGSMRALAAIPGSHMEVPSPPLWTIWTAYAALGWLAFLARRKTD